MRMPTCMCSLPETFHLLMRVTIVEHIIAMSSASMLLPPRWYSLRKSVLWTRSRQVQYYHCINLLLVCLGVHQNIRTGPLQFPLRNVGLDELSRLWQFGYRTRWVSIGIPSTRMNVSIGDWFLVHGQCEKLAMWTKKIFFWTKMYLTEAVASSELFQWFPVPNAPWDGNICLYIYHKNQPLHGSINIYRTRPMWWLVEGFEKRPS